MDTEIIKKGLLVSAYALSGVFIVLMIFYIIARLMVITAGKFSKNKKE